MNPVKTLITIDTSTVMGVLFFECLLIFVNGYPCLLNSNF
jgi:hypothetical protein